MTDVSRRLVDEMDFGLTAACGTLESNPVGYIDTMQQYYPHIDSAPLSDAQWAEKFLQLADIRKREAKQ